MVFRYPKQLISPLKPVKPHLSPIPCVRLNEGRIDKTISIIQFMEREKDCYGSWYAENGVVQKHGRDFHTVRNTNSSMYQCVKILTIAQDFKAYIESNRRRVNWRGRTNRQTAEQEQNPHGIHNVPLDNALLFLRDMLAYTELASSIRQGDPGPMIECIKSFGVCFQSTGLKFNYAKETIHLVASLELIWEKTTRDLVWSSTVFVNLFGLPNKWMTRNCYIELLVRDG